jgi:hypothetical protein
MIASSADLRKRIEEIMKTMILAGWNRLELSVAMPV